MTHPLHNRRAAYTLMELLTATASAGVLLVGMSSAIQVASQSMQLDDGELAAQGRNTRALQRLLDDAREAIAFSERSATALAFTVPDRDGDNQPESLRYAWSGTAGDPLTYELNGATPIPLIRDVQQLDFESSTRVIAAAELPIGSNAPAVVYESFSEAKLSSNGSEITLDVPPGTAAGDLLIAAVASDGPRSGTLSAPAGWTTITMQESDSSVTLGVWWKIASGSEGSTQTFTGLVGERAYAWMMRFTGHDPSAPINASTHDKGSFNFPPAKAVTTTVDKSMVLRIGAFDDDGVTVDAPGIADHTPITMDESNDGTNTASGGAAYMIQEVAGDTGDAEFELTRQEEYVTATIAIAPDVD